MDVETSWLFFTRAWVLEETRLVGIRIECPLGDDISEAILGPARQMQWSMGCWCFVLWDVFARRAL